MIKIMKYLSFLPLITLSFYTLATDDSDSSNIIPSLGLAQNLQKSAFLERDISQKSLPTHTKAAYEDFQSALNRIITYHDTFSSHPHKQETVNDVNRAGRDWLNLCLHPLLIKNSAKHNDPLNCNKTNGNLFNEITFPLIAPTHSCSTLDKERKEAFACPTNYVFSPSYHLQHAYRPSWGPGIPPRVWALGNLPQEANKLKENFDAVFSLFFISGCTQKFGEHEAHEKYKNNATPFFKLLSEHPFFEPNTHYRKFEYEEKVWDKLLLKERHLQGQLVFYKEKQKFKEIEKISAKLSGIEFTKKAVQEQRIIRNDLATLAQKACAIFDALDTIRFQELSKHHPHLYESFFEFNQAQ